MGKKLSLLLLAMLFVISGCSSDSGSSVSAGDVITKFKEAGLEAEDARALTSEDMGIAPMAFEEGQRFVLPSLGEDVGARVFVFKKTSDLDDLKKYYDEMGKASAMFFSHTYAKDKVLLQLPGKLEEEQVNKYKEVMDKL
ncbi:stress protein [Paenibacillus sp. B2(2019)]|uniref:stress protein n=1 Tax=Paenibacillus sp. B2(2019) TaxID=2607754 RepID=UPI0021D1EF26|nr:stress protein [Paenibacillus sp. B2(2019)]